MPTAPRPIRNLGVVAHVDAGKTALAEQRPGMAMLLSGTFQADPESECGTRVARMNPPPGAE